MELVSLIANSHTEATLRNNLSWLGRTIRERAAIPGSGTQVRVAYDEPQKCMGVEQQLHSMYSLISSSGSSKSGAMYKMLPLPNPGAGRGALGCCATSFATGCWFSVMMISSPARTGKDQFG